MLVNTGEEKRFWFPDVVEMPLIHGQGMNYPWTRHKITTTTFNIQWCFRTSAHILVIKVASQYSLHSAHLPFIAVDVCFRIYLFFFSFSFIQVPHWPRWLCLSCCDWLWGQSAAVKKVAVRNPASNRIHLPFNGLTWLPANSLPFRDSSQCHWIHMQSAVHALSCGHPTSDSHTERKNGPRGASTLRRAERRPQSNPSLHIVDIGYVVLMSQVAAPISTPILSTADSPFFPAIWALGPRLSVLSQALVIGELSGIPVNAKSYSTP